MTQKVQLHQASHEWATRPDDQRFLDLESLHTKVGERYYTSYEKACSMSTISDVLKHHPEVVSDYYTYSAFTQLCAMLGAPAGYLRTLPPNIVAQALAYTASGSGADKVVKILRESLPDGEHVRAFTSTTYGRIWDAEVVGMVMDLTSKGSTNWVVPAATYSASNPLRATTLYASDHDVFLFLVDPDTIVEVGEVKLHRGFMAWNSETGHRTFGLTTFLYESVCDNRIIWGAQDVSQILIRHTSGGPRRFQNEIEEVLRTYLDQSGSVEEARIEAAMDFRLGDQVEDLVYVLGGLGFTKLQATQAFELSASGEAGPGDPLSLWGAVQGLTKYAQTYTYNDERVQLERQAGSLLITFR